MVEAQRLVRKLCPECKQPYRPDPQIQKKYNLGEGLIYKAAGCNKCRNIGYFGRTGIYEIMVVNEDIRGMILRRATSTEIMDAAVKNGMETLLDSGIAKVRQGITSLEEVLSIVFTE